MSVIKKSTSGFSFINSLRFPNGNSTFYNFLHSFSLFTLLFSVVIFTDYFLPRSKEEVVIKDWYYLVDDMPFPKEMIKIPGALKNVIVIYQLETDKGKLSIASKHIDEKQLEIGDKLTVNRTLLFKSTTRIENLARGWKADQYMQLYGVLLIIPICLLLLALFSLSKRTQRDSKITLFVLQLLVFGFFIFFRLYY